MDEVMIWTIQETEARVMKIAVGPPLLAEFVERPERRTRRSPTNFVEDG